MSSENGFSKEVVPCNHFGQIILVHVVSGDVPREEIASAEHGRVWVVLPQGDTIGLLAVRCAHTALHTIGENDFQPTPELDAALLLLRGHPPLQGELPELAIKAAVLHFLSGVRSPEEGPYSARTATLSEDGKTARLRSGDSVVLLPAGQALGAGQAWLGSTEVSDREAPLGVEGDPFHNVSGPAGVFFEGAPSDFVAVGFGEDTPLAYYPLIDTRWIQFVEDGTTRWLEVSDEAVILPRSLLDEVQEGKLPAAFYTQLTARLAWLEHEAGGSHQILPGVPLVRRQTFTGGLPGITCREVGH